MKRVLIRKDGDKDLIQTSLQPFHAEVLSFKQSEKSIRFTLKITTKQDLKTFETIQKVLQFSGKYIVKFHLATHQIVRDTHYVDVEMRRV